MRNPSLASSLEATTVEFQVPSPHCNLWELWDLRSSLLLCAVPPPSRGSVSFLNNPSNFFCGGNHLNLEKCTVYIS